MADIVEDFLAPLVRYISGDSQIQELHTTFVSGGANPILGPPVVARPNAGPPQPFAGPTNLWIFRGFNEKEGTPYANVEGTGTSAITLAHTGYWGRPVRGSSLKFPIVTVYYHCDVSRINSLGAPSQQDAVDKCNTIHRRVSQLLHIKDNPTGDYHRLGAKPNGDKALLVGTSVMGRDLEIVASPGGDGMVEGRASFELEMFLR